MNVYYSHNAILNSIFFMSFKVHTRGIPALGPKGFGYVVDAFGVNSIVEISDATTRADLHDPIFAVLVIIDNSKFDVVKVPIF